VGWEEARPTLRKHFTLDFFTSGLLHGWQRYRRTNVFMVDLLYCRDEAVPPLRKSFDIGLSVLPASEGGTQLVDGEGEAVIFDGSARPHAGYQFILEKDLTGSFNKKGKQISRLPRKRYFSAALEKKLCSGIESEGVEFVHLHSSPGTLRGQ
jgi:hypothetical protein